MLPFRVYKLTVYMVPGCKPKRRKTKTPAQKHQQTSLLLCRPPVGVCCTWECVGTSVSGDGPCDCGMCATAGCGSDQIASDGFFF